MAAIAAKGNIFKTQSRFYELLRLTRLNCGAEFCIHLSRVNLFQCMRVDARREAQNYILCYAA